MTSGRLPGNATHDKLRAWLERNPAEALTVDDVAAKFECSPHTAENAVQHLRSMGIVTTARVVLLNPRRERN